jgi:acyl-CoA hydrolase
VQLGVGAIPDAILARLGEIEGVNLHSGMLSDGLADFWRPQVPARGSSPASSPDRSRCTSKRLAIHASSSSRRPSCTTSPYIASLERFVSINSAIEIDLSGQVNGEAIDGVQVSGVGGSLDFVEGARYSPGGMSVIALRSTARGRSRIVPRLREGTPVTVPRFAADIVVTEHGIARLEGLDLEARAAALAAIAAPEARHGLLGAGLEGSSGS